VEKLYLSRRNLVTLLQKLDSLRDGESRSCTIIKNDHAHPVYPQTLRRVAVTAVEAEDRYFSAVSMRLNLSRATLTTLLAHLDQQTEGAVDVDGMRITAVPDERYYGAHEASFTPVGHVPSEPVKK
jgi:hypothetical protein